MMMSTEFTEQILNEFLNQRPRDYLARCEEEGIREFYVINIAELCRQYPFAESAIRTLATHGTGEIVRLPHPKGVIWAHDDKRLPGRRILCFFEEKL